MATPELPSLPRPPSARTTRALLLLLIGFSCFVAIEIGALLFLRTGGWLAAGRPTAPTGSPPFVGPNGIAGQDQLFLRINEAGHLLVPGREAFSALPEIQYYVLTEFQVAKRAARQGQVNTLVTVHAAKTTDWKPVYEVLRESKSAGFRHWQLQSDGRIEPLEIKLSGGAREKMLDELALDEDLTVMVKSLQDGKISALLLRSLTGELAVPDLDALEAVMKRRLRDEALAPTITILAESKLQYGHLLEVAERCRKAGFIRIKLGPPPDLPD